jgi:hypothetical protein
VAELDRIVTELERLVAATRSAPSPGVSRPAPGVHAGLAHAITAAFSAGSFDLSLRRGVPTAGWAGMPEVAAVDALAASELPGPDVRRFITFTAAMDRARDADALWSASARLRQAHPWVFDPLQVAQTSRDDLTRVLRGFSVSQRHSQDVAAWQTIGSSLARAAGPIHHVIEHGEGDALELLAAVRTPGYPLLRGPKISTVWVRMLVYPGGATLTSMGALPVAVDVQVRRATENLALPALRGRPLADVRPQIERFWHDDVAAGGAIGPSGLENTASALDPAIWFLAKWGCSHCETAGRKVPVADFCAGCRLGRF